MTNAIEAGSSWCSWLPCNSSSLKANGGLKDRVCPHWRMLPGILSLAATVVAVVCAIVWDCPYLCFAFVPGGLASIYLIYLGWYFQHLKTLSESNEELKTSIDHLKEENQELQNQIHTFQDENRKLQESTKSLSDLIIKLKDENFNLTESNTELKKTIASLTKLEETLGIKAQAHVQQLDGLQQSLAKIEESAVEDHQTFSTNLSIFVEQVHKLKETAHLFEKTGSSVEEKMKIQVETLLNAARMLEAIFTKINEWKDAEHVERQIRTQQLLNNSVVKLEKQLSEGEGALKEQNKQIKELAAIKEGFSLALENLLSKIQDLNGVKEELKEEVRKAADAFNKYQLGGS